MTPDATLTTTTPAGETTTRPVPPSWASVAPLIARWQMALTPQRDGLWEVITHFGRAPGAGQCAENVPFAALPQAIADVAARCETEEETRR